MHSTGPTEEGRSLQLSDTHEKTKERSLFHLLLLQKLLTSIHSLTMASDKCPCATTSTKPILYGDQSMIGSTTAAAGKKGFGCFSLWARALIPAKRSKQHETEITPGSEKHFPQNSAADAFHTPHPAHIPSHTHTPSHVTSLTHTHTHTHTHTLLHTCHLTHSVYLSTLAHRNCHHHVKVLHETVGCFCSHERQRICSFVAGSVRMRGRPPS
jgi:hypothetical protein